jgi:type VI secretion system secreted protein VgrG
MARLPHTSMVARLTTPLGNDAFVITDFKAAEAISEPFAFDICAVSRHADIGGALGAPCTVALSADTGGTRYFSGILTGARRVERTGGRFRYALVLRPWLQLLDGPAGSRIFLDMTVRDILTEVFTAAGFQDFEFRIAVDPPVLTHCAQYRESGFAFCTRLMAQHGIRYFFAHRDGGHTLVMTDAPSRHRDAPSVPALTWLPGGAGPLEERPSGPWISNHTAEIAPQDRENGPGGRLCVSGNAVSLTPGSLVTVERHPDPSPPARGNRTFLVVRCLHQFTLAPPFADSIAPGRGGIFIEEQAGGGAATYDGSYEIQPGGRPFAVVPAPAKPQIAGVQTARVAAWPGMDGSDVALDMNGCIPVHFPWDRAPRQPCPVRVARNWPDLMSGHGAGGRQGAPLSLRAGTEVVVAFVDGDPDRPLVTGYVDADLEAAGVPPALCGHRQAGESSPPALAPVVPGAATAGPLVIAGDPGLEEGGNEDGRTDETGDGRSWTVTGNRTLTIRRGDDTTNVQFGDQTVNISYGNQTVNALQSITLNVCLGSSTLTITPGAVTIKSPVINLNADTMINLNAPLTAIPGGAVIIVPGPLTGFGTVVPPG